MPTPFRSCRAFVAALALLCATSAVAVLPGAPTGVSATAGNGSAVVHFLVPTDGGAPTSYIVRSSPGGITVPGPIPPIAVGGLTNGLAYTFTVQAVNGSGIGPASAPSNSVTPGTQTITGVTSAPVASLTGQSVTFTATVDIPLVIVVSPLSGTVSFKADGVVIPGCGAVPFIEFVTPRSTTCTTSALAAGPRSITADFSGTATLASSSSPPIVHNVLDPFPLFTFQDINDIGILVTSEPVTLSAFAGTLPITVTGGQYSIGCTANFTSAPGTVTSGATVCVRQVTPLAWSTFSSTILSVGGATSAFEPSQPQCCTPTQPLSIAAGIGHTLVISDNGDVWGWGDNTGGRLGNGTSSSTSLPVQVNITPIGLAAGLEHSLALDYDGTVSAWGLNSEGQLGLDPGYLSACLVPGQFGPLPDGSFYCRPYPGVVGGLQNVVSISAGWRHSLALKSDGTVWAWGSGYWGQNGATVTREAPVQVPINGTVVRIAAGYMHSVALLSDGTVVAWGSSQYGELGPAPVNANNINPTPRVVTGLANVTDIAAGGSYTLARKSDGTVWAWGANIYGAMGDLSLARSNGSGPVSRSTPAAIPGLTGVGRISAGFAAAFAIKDTGAIVSWGLDQRGQANGTPQAAPLNCGAVNGQSCILAPSAVSATSGATRVYAGGAHVVAAKNNGDLVMFGDNSAGQLATRAGNFGSKFVHTTYDPDTFLNPDGANGSPIGIGGPGTGGGLNLGTVSGGLAFTAVPVDTTSSPNVLSLTNLQVTGAITLSRIEAISLNVTGEYLATNTCPMSPASLAAGVSCNITLSFTPKGIGARDGQLIIESNAAGATYLQFALTGTGLDPRAASMVVVSSADGTTAALGAPLTFTATVTSSVAISGTVDFYYYNSVNFAGQVIPGCLAVPLASGIASCTTSGLPLGVNLVYASYSGSALVQPYISGFYTMLIVVPSYALTVTRAGAGSGTVTSDGNLAIQCGVACSASYTAGTIVVLTASAGADSLFSGWSGACTGTGTCSVTMDAAKSVTATFAKVTFALGVSRTGPGSGTVTSSPAGIDCGAACSASFDTGTAVTLTAISSPGSLFGGWSGGGCSGTGTCTVTLLAATTVTATFALQPPNTFALAVTPAGSGMGTVTSTPAGINCGTACVQGFTTGTLVALAASPAAGSTFAGWSGACAGTGTCNVTMDAARSVTATFTRVTYALATAKAGAGSGTVTSSPAGISCGATCSASYAAGTVVVLTATPATDSFFAGWSGACAGMAACNLTMDAAKNVTAGFAPNASIPRLGNISTRMQVLTGNDVAIGGFVVEGSVAKTVVVRARGPSLIPYGIANALANPVLQLVRASDQVTIAGNDDWGSAANAAQVSAAGFAPTDALESAILITLSPGAYTAIMTGAQGGTGVGIVEVFEVDHPEVPLVNISTRGQVFAGNDVMIGGFVIQGEAPQTVVVRARGPSLIPYGIPNALANPVLQIYQGTTQLAINDDWASAPNAALINSSGFAPSNALESAILITLPPGAYTAVVTGFGGGTGVGIVEVFAQ